MAAQDSIGAKLEAAKGVLAKASKLGNEVGSLSISKHEFSNVPYSMAKKSLTPGEDTAAGLKSRRQNVGEYLKQYPNK